MLGKLSSLAKSLRFFAAYHTIESPNNAPIAYFDLEDNHYHRYFYTFVKFLSLGGYRLHLACRPLVLHRLQHDPYARLAFEERLLHLGKPKGTIALDLNSSRLSPDYFSGLWGLDKPPRDAYFVPIAQHPLMYHKGWWDAPLPSTNRKNAVFMIGAFDAKMYQELVEDQLFKVLGRLQVAQKLQPYRHAISSLAEFQNYLHSAEEGQLLLLDRADFAIPMPELRPTLAHFAFYLALPGVAMPFSHNIVEAMSAGCIPILQRGYAELFRPALRHAENCWLFEGEEDLYPRIQAALALPAAQRQELQKGVEAYYAQHLSPQAIVQHMQTQPSKIYLQAEHRSVMLLKARL
jgi:hypothetical protein